MTVLVGALSQLPFSSARIVLVEHGVVWTSGTLSGNRAELATGFDARTGQQVTGATGGDVGRSGTVGGAGGSVDGASARRDETPRLGIEAPRIPGKPARLCLRDRATGKETAAVDLPGTFHVMPLAFVIDGRNALAVNDQAELVVVDTASLRVARTVPLPAPETVAKRVTPLLRAGGQSWLVRVDASRGVTEVAPLDSTTGATGTPLVFEGRVVAVEGADSGILLICERAGLSLATIASLRADHPRFELPLAQARSCAAGGSLFAVAELGCVSLVEMGNGSFSWHRLPLPDGAEASDLAVTEDALLVIAGRSLLSLERPPFSPGGPHALDLELHTAPPVAASAVPGVVVFAGPSLVAVNHPEYKRVNLRPGPGGAPYAKGQRIYFDQVEMPPTGVVTAVAWHREGEPVPRRAGPPALVLRGQRLASFTPPPVWPRRAPGGPPSPPASPEYTLSAQVPSAQAPFTQAPSAPDSHSPRAPSATKALDRLARLLGFEPAPLLRDLLRRHDEDASFARLLGGLSLDILIRDESSATEFWPQADPCLTDLATDGDGNAFCFYDYPPLRGAPPPVVQWVHDDVPNVQWRGPDFDTFFADWLSRRAGYQRAVVAAVLEELGLPASWPREYTLPPPPWLAATFGPVDVPAIDSAESAGDLLRAERLLVGAVGQTYKAAAAAPLVDRLARIYEALGWHRQLATLRSGRAGSDERR